MNINFHYFAVKTLAMAAGFEDTHAQQLAKYSQFVDDYNAPLLMSCSNIPKEIITSGELDLYVRGLSGNFQPVSTGFSSPFEYATLIVRREQRFILSPFHFAPYDKTGAGLADNRVILLTCGDNSLMDRLIHREISDFNSSSNQSIHLMRIGMLLHIFADSYAHQGFTGFLSGVNRVNITGVKNNLTGKDCTVQARDGIRRIFNTAMSNIPAIGHVQAGHNPDLSHVSFRYTDESGKGHSRDNTEAFLEAARNIFMYFRICIGGNSDIVDDWGTIAPKLRQGLLVEMPRRNVMSSLAAHWRQIFPGIDYHYDSNEIRRSFRLTPISVAALARNAFSAYSDEFYGYNAMANEILVALYGPRPRR